MTATIAPPAFGASKGSGRRKVKNNVMTGLVWLSFGIALVPLVWLLYTVLDRGLHAMTRNGWFTHSQRGLTFTDPGGGAYHAILGTLEEVGFCTLISVPIAIMVAIYLVEYGNNWLARITTFMVDILTGVPSIVAALFIYALFLATLGGQFAGVYASLALVLLMVPVVVRTTEEMLKLVPNELREASYALGVPKWKTIVKIVLPTAFTGITTGVVLGIARVAGETAPLLVLVKYTPNINGDLFSGFQASLPLMIRDQVNNLGASYGLNADGARVKLHNYAPDRLWGAALTLILIVMLLNLIARLVGRFNKVSN
ncbi:MAG: phosphate ABC transporter permease PstA [Actinobacteria bacterium]|nr:phosphate ABC transporter permease PstA [Actinomycetota bacterium]